MEVVGPGREARGLPPRLLGTVTVVWPATRFPAVSAHETAIV
jgi:hypothetical protein